MTTLHTTQIAFDLPLPKHRDLEAFRGAVAALIGWKQDLFHNHDNAAPNAFQQRYPLIQYRRYQGYASILGINAGAKALEELVEADVLGQFSYRGQPMPLHSIGFQRDPEFEAVVKRRAGAFHYRIRDYLPFSQERYREYKRTQDPYRRREILERILRNHIVAFAYGVDWQLPKERRIQVGILDIQKSGHKALKNQAPMAFDLVFAVNARLPEGIGLGRKTAFDCGVVTPLEYQARTDA